MNTCRAILIVLLLSAPAVTAQDSPSFYEFVRGSLKWHTVETQHFKIHYHMDDAGRGSERSAREVSRIAESVYAPITELYEYEPDSKVSIVLRDFEDYSNGAAYFFDDMIVLWVPALDTPLRGHHDWLRNVVTHEFTHIVQVQASMKSSRKMPFFYFQLLTYEDVRRPDVLYGYPNGIVTYPIPVLSNPAWLAEGTAQYQRADFDYDTWDTHRDMLLRTRMLAGKELSLADMGGFYSHNSLERETVYNQGFAFTQYLASEYGEKSLADISRALGSWRVWNFEGGAKRALGISGSDLFQKWVDRLRAQYEDATAALRDHEVSGEVIESRGFLNLYPEYSPDGQKIAYLSNRGHDFSTVALYVVDASDMGGEGDDVVQIDDVGAIAPPYTCALGHRVAPGVYGSFNWHPSGQRLTYARRKDTGDGSYFSDVYEFDLESKMETRVTNGQRARSPAYSPDGQQIVFVSERDGTSNLYVASVGSGESRVITAFSQGEQISDPAWSTTGGVYVTYSSDTSNDILRIDVASGEFQHVVSSVADERNPFVDAAGRHLYYSSDESGIFNLYRRFFESPDSVEQLTNVLGGAFMPSVSPTGSMIFSSYKWNGYKIARTDVRSVQDSSRIAYDAPKLLSKWSRQSTAGTFLGEAGGTQTMTEPDGVVRFNEAEGVRASVDVPSTMIDSLPDTLSSSPYRSEFTAFSFFPVLRFDQYVSRRRGRAEVRLPDRSRGETLLRNTKLGFYVASREVLDGLSMLGGLLVGPSSGDATSFGDFFAPSSLIDLERDLFVRFDYRKGVFFRDKRWSPQFALQLFNVRRNVENGLAFEELACTACFPPDTTLADLSYNLWELDLSARSKISRGLMVEAGYRFSPYRVTTERFFSTEFQQEIPASSSRYYIGRALRAKLYVEALRPHRHGDVVRSGITAELTYEFEPGRLLDRFDVEDGVLAPKYKSFKNHRLTADIRYGRVVRIGRDGSAPHGLGVRLRASTILGAPVDDFFDDYVGGLIGARGYPFYALGGNETLWFQLAYLVPVFPRIHQQLWFLYIDKLYARVYADAALAWSGKLPGIADMRKDVGAELRLGIGSFYLLPTAVFVSATYGVDEFNFDLDDEFVTPDGGTAVSYGRDLQWHFGVLFGFDL